MKNILIILIVLFSTHEVNAKKPEFVPFSNTISWTFCQDKKQFDCFVVKDKKIGRRTVVETWESLFPDAATRTLVQKLNRLNIKLRKGMFIAVPKDTKKTLADFSPFDKELKTLKDIYSEGSMGELSANPPVKDRTATKSWELLKDIRNEKVIIWSPAHLALGLYDENGRLVRWLPAIGGRDRCLDTWKKCHTVTGKFQVGFIGDENSRSHLYPIGCPKKEPCAPMPHFVGFHQCYPRERMCFYGFHSSSRMEGKHASHGCVRLFLDDAKWLNQNFAKVGMRVIALPYPPNKK